MTVSVIPPPVTAAKLPCSLLILPQLSVSFSLSTHSSSRRPPPSLLALSICFPAPPVPFFFSTVVVRSTVPHRYLNPSPCSSLLAASSAAAASSFPRGEAPSTKHSVGPGAPRKMRNPGSPFQVLLCCSVPMCLDAVRTMCRAPRHPCPLSLFVPLYPCIPYPHVPSHETRRTTEYVCVASPPPSPSHPHHLEFVSNSSLLPFLQLTLSWPRADSFPRACPSPPRERVSCISRVSTALSISVSE